MEINFGIPTDCPKCMEEDKRRNAINEQAGGRIPPYTSLNCFCRDGPNWEETSVGWQYIAKDINDFENVFNYIEWVLETNSWGDECLLNVISELEEYIKEITLENHKLEQLLAISQGFDPNFKSIITGEPLWPSEEE